MTALARWRTGAFVAMAAGALLPLTLAQWARGRYERALSRRVRRRPRPRTSRS